MDSNYRLILVALTLVLVAHKPVPMKDRIKNTTNVTHTVSTPYGNFKCSQTNNSWRFSFNGSKLMSIPAFCTGYTWAKWNIIEAPTLTDSTNMITTLGIVLTTEQKAQIQELEPIPTTGVTP